MAKVTIALCDVKPCTSQAEREFEVNGKTIYACGEQCFARFWTREYGNWKESRYRMQVTFQRLTLLQERKPQEAPEEKNSIEIFRADLQIAKRR